MMSTHEVFATKTDTEVSVLSLIPHPPAAAPTTNYVPSSSP
jgi:hypothetical protein